MCQTRCNGKKAFVQHRTQCALVRGVDAVRITPSSSDTPILKPILKWVGGKTQIISTLLKEFPDEIQNYHEVFLGGGSVLLGLLSYAKAGVITIRGTVYAYDLNEPLVYLYKNIQSDHEALYAEIRALVDASRQCTGDVVHRTPSTLEEATTSQESHYYWTRARYNRLSLEEQRTVEGSALFLFLNKTCFRGVFRVGPNGFNVPFGHYDNPEVIHKKHLDDVHDLIRDVRFEVSDFSESLPRAKEGDFVYLDPPYAPEKETSFVGYTLNGFGAEQHNALFGACRTHLTEKNVKMMMSNSDVPLTREAFQSSVYTIKALSCKRSINSKKPGSKAKEIVVTNY